MSHLDMPSPKLPLWWRLVAWGGLLVFVVSVVMGMDKCVHWVLR